MLHGAVITERRLSYHAVWASAAVTGILVRRHRCNRWRFLKLRGRKECSESSEGIHFYKRRTVLNRVKSTAQLIWRSKTGESTKKKRKNNHDILYIRNRNGPWPGETKVCVSTKFMGSMQWGSGLIVFAAVCSTFEASDEINQLRRSKLFYEPISTKTIRITWRGPEWTRWIDNKRFSSATSRYSAHTPQVYDHDIG